MSVPQGKAPSHTEDAERSETLGWKGKSNTQPAHLDLSALPFDPLRATATSLQLLLQQGKLTSVDLVDTYLKVIAGLNWKLHAVLQTAPVETLKQRARWLDAERKGGRECGGLWGIPVIVKDNIDTDPALGMGTTCGSFALMHARPKGNAPLVDGLVAAGAIIIAKANLSEFAYLFGEGLPCGWSAVGGQTASAYITTGFDPTDPVAGPCSASGSSSGSCVSISAGMSPISIGTETCGSLVMPADRAALYTIKPTIGLVSTKGIVPASDFCDSAGPMTRSAADLAVTLDAIVDPKMKGKVPEGGFVKCLSGGWEGLRVGCVREGDWPVDREMVGMDEGFEAQRKEDIEAAYKKLEELGAKVTYPIELISEEKLKMEDGKHALFDTWKGNMARLMNSYLSELDHTHVRSMQEIVDFNNSYHHLELPLGINQNFLLQTLASPFTPSETSAAIAHCRSIGRDQGIDHTLRTHNLDVILGPADSELIQLISAAGYPICTLPLSAQKKSQKDGKRGRPFGLCAIAGEWREDILFRVMGAWEETMGARLVPDLGWVLGAGEEKVEMEEVEGEKAEA